MRQFARNTALVFSFFALAGIGYFGRILPHQRPVQHIASSLPLPAIDTHADKPLASFFDKKTGIYTLVMRNKIVVKYTRDETAGSGVRLNEIAWDLPDEIMSAGGVVAAAIQPTGGPAGKTIIYFVTKTSGEIYRCDDGAKLKSPVGVTVLISPADRATISIDLSAPDIEVITVTNNRDTTRKFEFVPSEGAFYVYTEPTNSTSEK